MSLLKPILAASLLVGIALGIGSYTFVYAKGASYMSDNPTACANCHIMGDHYDAWVRSSHRNVATCNDCHTPAGTVAKYINKAENGFWHSVGFTFGGFPEPLQITPGNARVTEQSCRKCHESITLTIEGLSHDAAAGRTGEGTEQSCVQCHASVGHWVR
jgi:cytochrome c nitrite reductase small subunit